MPAFQWRREIEGSSASSASFASLRIVAKGIKIPNSIPMLTAARFLCLTLSTIVLLLVDIRELSQKE
jgi:hypothetical protein